MPRNFPFALTICLMALAAGAPAQASDDPGEAVVRQLLEEVWSKGNLELTHKIVHSDYQFHSPVMRIVGPTGPDLLNSMVETRRASFSDLTYTIQDLFSEGDKVVARWTAAGTHDGKLGEAEPTGKKIAYEGIAIFQMAGDQIYQEWVMDSFANVLRQLGVRRLEIRR